MTAAPVARRDWLERTTSASRGRVAEELFLGRPARRGDRLVSRVYFAVAARRWGAYGADPHHLAAFRAGLVHCGAPQRVLDVGTGTADAAAYVARQHPGAEVVAVDTSSRMLKLARSRHGTCPNLTFHRVTVAALPFPDAWFDLATCVNAVPDPVELRRVLAPGGHVLAAATTLPLRDETSEWVARWHEVGFERIAGDDVDGGSWELYRR